MLTVDDIVRVNVNVNQSTGSEGVFDVGLIMTPTTFFTEEKRVRVYNSFAEASDDLIEMGFTTTSQIYRHVLKYFAAEHAPRQVIVSCYPRGTANVTDETPAEAFVKLLKLNQRFYGVCVANVSDDDPLLELEETIRATGKQAILFLAIPNPVEYAVDEARIMYKMYERRTDRCSCLYCNQPAHAAVAMGEMMGLISAHNDSAFTMCYRRLQGGQSTALTPAEEASIKAINGNVCVARGNFQLLYENGTAASGRKLEDVLYTDMITSELQNSILDLITGSLVKLPQTDATTAMFISECNRVLERYYNMGVLATQPWRKAGIGNVANGDIIEHGYICMADSFNNQSVSDRSAHNSMPITILLCLSGSVESIEITLNVQQ